MQLLYYPCWLALSYFCSSQNSLGQDLNNYQRQYVTEKNAYKEIQLKPNARFSKFCLIPDSAHFNVIENPYGCAKAIIYFIDETN